MNRTPYEAGGFAFPDEKMMEKAVKEGEGIRYIQNSADMKDTRMVFDVYCQMVKQRLFETPVGYVYLHGLQEKLKEDPLIYNQDIPAIPVAAYETRTKQTGQAGERRKSAGGQKITENRQKKVKNIDYKPWFKASVSVSIILLLIVIGMFAVTATSGNINIVNYENALIEKYENWETKLKEKEEKLREREQSLRSEAAETGNFD